MKKVFCAIAVAAIGSSFAAPALATDRNIPLQAIVPEFCRIEGSAVDVTDGLTTIPLVGDVIDTTAINRSYGVQCNRPSNITLTTVSGGLRGPVAALPDFEHIINYSVEGSGFVTIPSTPTTGLTAGQNIWTGTRASPGNTALNLTITPIANTDPLVAGTYDDTLRVRIEPQP
jgi:hypothetical protein